MYDNSGFTHFTPKKWSSTAQSLFSIAKQESEPAYGAEKYVRPSPIIYCMLTVQSVDLPYRLAL